MGHHYIEWNGCNDAYMCDTIIDMIEKNTFCIGKRTVNETTLPLHIHRRSTLHNIVNTRG